MKKILLLLLASLFFISCESEKIPCYVCDKESNEKIEDFISKNIKSQDLKDDDLVEELRKTAIKIFCRQEFVNSRVSGEIDYNSITKRTDETYHLIY